MSDQVSTSEDGRIIILDALKGAAIIGVMISHMALSSFSGDLNNPSTLGLGELFYAALPLFAIITGYLYKPGRNLGYNMRYRFLPMTAIVLFSIVAMTSVMFCYLWAAGYDLSDTDFWGDLFNAVIGRGSFSPIEDTEIMLGIYDVSFQFYYLMALIVGDLIFYALVERIVYDWRKVLATVVILQTITCVYIEFVGIQLPFFIQLGPTMASLLFIGAFMARIDVVGYLERGYREKRYWVLFAATAISATVLILFFPTGMKFCYSIFGDYGGWSAYTFVAEVVAAGMFLLFVASFVCRVVPIARVLCFIGRYIQLLYITHVLVGRIILSFFVKLNNQTWFPVSSVTNGVLLAIATMLLILTPLKLKESRMRKASGY